MAKVLSILPGKASGSAFFVGHRGAVWQVQCGRSSVAGQRDRESFSTKPLSLWLIVGRKRLTTARELGRLQTEWELLAAKTHALLTAAEGRSSPKRKESDRAT